MTVTVFCLIFPFIEFYGIISIFITANSCNIADQCGVKHQSIEGRRCFISRRTQHILFTVIWRQTFPSCCMYKSRPITMMFSCPHNDTAITKSVAVWSITFLLDVNKHVCVHQHVTGETETDLRTKQSSIVHVSISLFDGTGTDAPLSDVVKMLILTTLRRTGLLPSRERDVAPW